MLQFLSFFPTLLGWIGRAGTVLPEVIQAIGVITNAIKAVLPQQVTQAKPLDVKWLQTTLKGAGFDPGPVDGVYGEKTKAAVSAYQKARNLTVDGWAGVATTVALVAEGK